jgi:hypothetical protein
MMGINRADKDSLKCTSNENYSQLMAGDRSSTACCGASLMKIINYLFKSRRLGIRGINPHFVTRQRSCATQGPDKSTG